MDRWSQNAEGCFSISIRNRLKSKIGLRIEAIFSISLHQKDRAILELIKSYFFGVGNIYKHGKDSIQYRVTSQQDLTNVIIPQPPSPDQ